MTPLVRHRRAKVPRPPSCRQGLARPPPNRFADRCIPGKRGSSLTSHPDHGGLSGAVVSRSPLRFFFLQDFERGYSATVGLVSPVADLNVDPDCGGAGPEVYDGGGTEKVVSTPAGSVHLRDRWQNATLVIYDRATNDVCELADPATHPVLARGQANFSFGVRDADVTDATVNFHFQMTGVVDLTSGGKAHVLLTANFFVDDDGNFHVRVDKFELKPIGG